MNRAHLPLLLLAAVLALAVKVAVTEREQLIQADFPGQVQVPVPEDLVRLGTIDPVQIRLQATATTMTRFNPANIQVRPSVTIDAPGLVEITLEPDDVQLPDDFEVLAVEPNKLTIEVDKRIIKTVPISVQVTGEPAAGAQVVEKVVRPPAVEIVGPEKLLANVDELVASVSIDRRAITFEERVTPVMPDASVRLRQPVPVVVQIRMEEPQLNIDLGDVVDDDEDTAS